MTERTALRPTGSYGTHKSMVELYLADQTRRGLVNGRAVRPAGIVARPRDSYAGFATAWMSDIFHAALERRDIQIPARPDAHVWLQSVDKVADNIIHAALMQTDGLKSDRAWTLPTTVTRIDSLVDALSIKTSHCLRVDYRDGPTDQPPLDASDALAVGFTDDGNVVALVDAVIAGIGRQ